MKRVLVLLAGCALAAMTGFLPWKASDAASLLPVSTLLIDVSEGQTVLYAVDELQGAGDDLAAAMEDMASRAPGNLFFGQVERVVVSQDAMRVLYPAAKEALLRLNTAVYCSRELGFTEEIAELEPYWSAAEQRGTLTTLLECCADGAIPVLLDEEGRPWKT